MADWQRIIASLLGTWGVWFALTGCEQAPAPDKYQTYDQLLTSEQAVDSPDPSGSTEPGNNDDAPARSDTPSMTETNVVAGPSSDSEAPPATDTAGPSADPTTVANLVEETPIPASALAPLNLVDGRSAADILMVAQGTGTPPGNPGPTTTTADAVPRQIELLVPERTFAKEGREKAWRVSYDDLDLLKILNMEPVPTNATEYFPTWLENLNGQTIRLRGFMYPNFLSSGIEQFVLARDNQICCFGRDPKIYDLVAVTMLPGKTTDYIPNRPFDVIGTFRIELLEEEGKLLGLYWLENAQVIDR